MAVCLQETFLKPTDNITVKGFNLYHKFQETENRASGGVSIFVNENIPQSIIKLNTNLQAVAVKVTAHKTITLCSVYLPPRNHFNFNPKDLQNVIDQLPSPFILMGDFYGHHTLWWCEDVNNRGQQLEDLILKNDLSGILNPTNCSLMCNVASDLSVARLIILLDLKRFAGKLSSIIST